MKPGLLTSLILLVLSIGSQAGEVMHSHVDYADGHYLVRVVMTIEAEAETVYAILTDFNHLTTLNKSIKRSQLLKSEGKHHMVKIEAEGCVWFYCQKVVQTQWLTERDNGYISAITLPEQSNLEYGRVLWHIRQEDEYTTISYRADVVPNFFVPPLIGPYIMKKRMLEKATETLHNIERIAQYEENY